MNNFFRIIFYTFFLAFSYSQFSLNSVEAKKIYLYAELWGDILATDGCDSDCIARSEPLRDLHTAAAHAGYELIQIHSLDNLKDFEKLLVFEVPLDQLHHLSQYPKKKVILFLWEPPTTLPNNFVLEYHRYFSKVFTWNDDLIDNKKYFKFYYPCRRLMIQDSVDFSSKTLCTLISSNLSSPHPNELYSERFNVINFFEHHPKDDFHFYGRSWPYSFRNYKGTVHEKSDVMKYYKFCYCYENIKGIPGYISEKIFDCFHAGCVPIYWGASNITKYIPKKCFIDRLDFETDLELYHYLENMTETQHREYVKNIRRFLNGRKSQLFSNEFFIETVMKAIKSNTMLRIPAVQKISNQ